jgi:coenzyme F420-reducing hydrogenase beta subunit
MIEIKEKNNCCGCGSCAQACPLNCIEMREDKEGFLYPVVDKKRCVQCHKCEKVCPIINKSQTSDKIVSSYAAYSNDEKLLDVSSSGAVFSEIALHILEKGGMVFGAAFDENMMVNHVGIDDKDNLFLLQGSKYLQSRIEDSFVQVKNCLKEGKIVLFSGTACQIAGLKSFLGERYENLITVDVLCHGVPSPLLWRKYLAELGRNKKTRIASVSFRDKEEAWNNYNVVLEFEDSSRISEKFYRNVYMKLFLKNISLRPSCYDCRFKNLERESDITIGDCWGIEKTCPEMMNPKGVSVVMIHSKTGEDIFNGISDNLRIKEYDIDKLLPPSSDSRKSVPLHRNRKRFFKKLRRTRKVSKLVDLLKPPISERVKRKLGLCKSSN